MQKMKLPEGIFKQPELCFHASHGASLHLSKIANQMGFPTPCTMTVITKGGDQVTDLLRVTASTDDAVVAAVQPLLEKVRKTGSEPFMALFFSEAYALSNVSDAEEVEVNNFIAAGGKIQFWPGIREVFHSETFNLTHFESRDYLINRDSDGDFLSHTLLEESCISYRPWESDLLNAYRTYLLSNLFNSGK